MVRLSDTPASLRSILEQLECPTYDNPAFVTGSPLSQRRVAIISTAGLQMRGDRPFAWGASDYRIIPGEADSADIVMSHVSTNFDRSGFQQDINVALPLDRLRELADEGAIGSVADYHYSFMGATAPDDMADAVADLAPILQADGVDAILLAPI